MTRIQKHALANPLSRANVSMEPFRLLTLPWSLILTVNK